MARSFVVLFHRSWLAHATCCVYRRGYSKRHLLLGLVKSHIIAARYQGSLRAPKTLPVTNKNPAVFIATISSRFTNMCHKVLWRYVAN